MNIKGRVLLSALCFFLTSLQARFFSSDIDILGFLYIIKYHLKKQLLNSSLYKLIKQRGNQAKKFDVLIIGEKAMKRLVLLAIMAQGIIIGAFIMTVYRIFVARNLDKTSFEKRKSFLQKPGMIVITISTLIAGFFYQEPNAALLKSLLIMMYFFYLFVVFFYLPRLDKFVK